MTQDLQGASAWSSGSSIQETAARVVGAIQSRLVYPPRLAIVVGIELSQIDLREALSLIHAELAPTTLLGTTSPALIASEGNLSETPSIGILALTGLHAHPFSLHNVEYPHETFPESIDRIGEIMGAGDETQASLLFASQRGLAIQSMLPRLNAARGLGRHYPILGGVVEDATLILNNQVYSQGIVGVTLSGDFRFDAITSQGTTPVGDDLVVTRAKGNLIQSLAGKPALQMLGGAHEIAGMQTPLFLARLIDENSPTRGRGDYLVRTIVGMDEASGSIAVDELIRPGQTVRFHRHDQETAESDLAMLLDGNKLHGPPAAAITFSGADRKVPDGVVISRAFQQAKPGASRSRSGQELAGANSTLPILGAAGAGEIGPIQDVSYLHRQAAVVGLFRPTDKGLFSDRS